MVSSAVTLNGKATHNPLKPHLKKKALRLDTGKFSYLELGTESGPLVLLVHGFPDHPQSFIPVMERLAAEGFRTVAPWLRGYAPSTLEGPFHADQLADDLAALAKALSPNRPPLLVGHDWGAVATYGALSRNAKSFSAGVTLAVPHPGAFSRNVVRSPGQWLRSRYMLLFQAPGLSDRVVSAAHFAYIEKLWSRWSPGYRPCPKDMEELKRTLALSMPAPLCYYRENFRQGGRMRNWAHIQAPTLYLHGESDGCVAPALGDKQGRFFTGPFEAHVVKNAGHFLQLEAPDEVSGHILTWARRCGTG